MHSLDNISTYDRYTPSTAQELLVLKVLEVCPRLPRDMVVPDCEPDPVATFEVIRRLAMPPEDIYATIRQLRDKGIIRLDMFDNYIWVMK